MKSYTPATILETDERPEDDEAPGPTESTKSTR